MIESDWRRDWGVLRPMGKENHLCKNNLPDCCALHNFNPRIWEAKAGKWICESENSLVYVVNPRTVRAVVHILYIYINIYTYTYKHTQIQIHIHIHTHMYILF